MGPQDFLEEEGRDRGAKSNHGAASKPDPHGEEEEQLGPEMVPPKTWPHGFLEEERWTRQRGSRRPSPNGKVEEGGWTCKVPEGL